jgi:hypothetical protein
MGSRELSFHPEQSEGSAFSEGAGAFMPLKKNERRIGFSPGPSAQRFTNIQRSGFVVFALDGLA